jgi:hypothetical protein
LTKKLDRLRAAKKARTVVQALRFCAFRATFSTSIGAVGAELVMGIRLRRHVAHGFIVFLQA